MKIKLRKSRIKGWLNRLSTFLSKRYIVDCHPAFMTYIEKNNIITASIWNDARNRRFNEIWKLINSDKYKKYFYNAVDYNYKRGESPKPIPKKWYVVAYDKTVYHLSKAYVFLFEKELYKKIKQFERISKGVVSLTKRMDAYIASTTSLQRLSRMQMLGIISRESFQDDIDVIFCRVSPDEVETRNKEKYVENPGTFGSQWSMKREIPNDISKLFRKV